MVIQLSESHIDYVKSGRRMIKSYLTHTPHPILLVTNRPKDFEDLLELGELHISYMPSQMNKFEGFDYTLKMEAIAQASTCNVDSVYFVDGDLYTCGWDEESFQALLHNQDVDVLGRGAKFLNSVEFFRGYRKGGWYEPIEGERGVYTHREDRLLFTNMDMLRRYVEVYNTTKWDDLLSFKEDNNEWELSRGKYIESWRCKEGCDGFVMGMCLEESKGTYKQLLASDDIKFTHYERVERRPTIRKPYFTTLDSWWRPLLKED